MQIAIVLYPGMTALDAIGPYEVLRGMRDVELRLVWKEVGPVVTDSGLLVLGATHSLAETPRPVIVLVPGSGVATPARMNDTELCDWLRQVHGTSVLTASVCSGSAILAAAGLLEDHEATSHWAAMPVLASFGVVPRPDLRIVRSGKLISSAGVSAGIDLALTIVAELQGAERAQAIQLLIEYDPQPPFDAGHMSKASPSVAQLARREMNREAVHASAIAHLGAALLRRWLTVLWRRVRGVRSPPLGAAE